MRRSTATALARRLGLWVLARLQRARQLALLRGRHATAKHHRPIVVVAVEPVSADWFYETLVASLRRRCGNGEKPLPFQVVRLSSSQAAQRLVGNQPASAIIVAELDQWFWRLEKCDLLYLRPGLMILRDILRGIGREPGAPGAPALIQCLDRLLSKHRAISLETLFHEPHRTAEYLNRWWGIDLVQPNDFPAAREERYRKAQLAILRLVERGPFADNSAMISFAVGGTYATTYDGAGSLALGEGWSWREGEHTWSDGPRASLAIRLAANRGTRLHLRLDGMLAPGAMSVRVFAGGQLATEISKGESPPRDHSIALSLAYPLADPILSIEMEFSNTFCPRDAGFSLDDRHLGFALRSFTITEETLLAASLRSLIRRRSPGVTLALSMHLPDDSFGLGRLLAESGLSGSLITLVDPQAAQGGWLENQQPIPFPGFATIGRSNGNEALPDAVRVGSGVAGAATSGLCEACFSGTLPQLLAELAQRRSFLDLIVLSADELFGRVLDALEPVITAAPKALPDIAICTDDAAFFDRSFLQHRARYGRVVHRFAMAMVEPQLISLTGRIV